MGQTKKTTATEETVLTELQKELKKGNIAGVIAEPIQGRAGERCFPLGFFKKVAILCKEAGALLIFDEIYTGFGRTGPLLHCETLGVVPDLLCLGKALGGGLPISVCAGDVVAQWPQSNGEARHTSTFLGHPLACAVGTATIKEIQRQLPVLARNLPAIDSCFHDFLREMYDSPLSEDLAFEIRGTGWMRGFWFFRAPDGFAVQLSEQLLQQGFLTLPSGPRGRVLSWTPPLIITLAELKKFLKALSQLLLAMKH